MRLGPSSPPISNLVIPWLEGGTACQSGRSVSITLWPYVADGRTRRYFLSREHFLDTLLDDRLLKTLNNSPRLPHLLLEILENDIVHDATWWEEEINSRVPESLHGVFSFRVDEDVEDASEPFDATVITCRHLN